MDSVGGAIHQWKIILHAVILKDNNIPDKLKQHKLPKYKWFL